MPSVNEMDVDILPNINVLVSDLEGVRSACEEGARAIADQAVATAPYVTGRYVEGIEVEKTKSGARVISRDPKSHWIEFGNAHQPAQFILRQAAEAVGFKFRKKRR